MNASDRAFPNTGLFPSAVVFKWSLSFGKPAPLSSHLWIKLKLSNSSNTTNNTVCPDAACAAAEPRPKKKQKKTSCLRFKHWKHSKNSSDMHLMLCLYCLVDGHVERAFWDRLMPCRIWFFNWQPCIEPRTHNSSFLTAATFAKDCGQVVIIQAV